MQLKSYLRENLILNLIFIQNYKEFKDYDNNFYLNLNLLPTTTGEYYNSLNKQLYNEAIKNNLLNVFFINQLLKNLDATAVQTAGASAAQSDSASVRNLGTSLGNASGTGLSDFHNKKEVSYLNVFYYIQNLLEEYTQNYIKQVKNSSVDLLPKSGIGPAGADSSSSAAENKKIIKLELEYENLVNEIIFDLYDEFKYGEALGLINKVVYKNVKKLVSENKK